MIFKTVSTNTGDNTIIHGDLEESDWAKHHDTKHVKDMESEVKFDFKDFDINYKSKNGWSVRVIIFKGSDSFAAIYHLKKSDIVLDNTKLFVWETINRLTK